MSVDLNKDIWLFYKLLICLIIIDDNKILVVVFVLLLDFLGKFEIFKVYILLFVMFKFIFDLKNDLVV